MKLLLTFFIFLCFHLSGGLQFAQASSGSHSAVHLTKTKAVERTGTSQHCRLTYKTNSPDEKDLLFFEEEYDNEESFSRKVKLPTEYLSKFIYAVTTTRFYKDLTDHLSVFSNNSSAGSCKYIAQRALRI